jgi:O-antigen ligase
MYTSNFNYGLKDLETKLSLFLFPIAIFISKLDYKKLLPSILKWFVIGNIVAVVICFIEATYHFFLTGDSNELLYAKLSFFHHPSYFSLYLNFAIAGSIIMLVKRNVSMVFNPFLTSAICIVFGLTVILLSAKTGIITLALIIFCTLFYWIKEHRAYIRSFAVVILLVSSFVLVYNSSNTFRVRIDEFTNTLVNKNKSETSTTALRISAWNSSIELIQESPLIGYGVGDAKDALIKRYEDKQLDVLFKKKINAHNQFLQTAVSIGLVGGLILLGYFIFPLYYSFKNSHLLYISFLLLFAANIFTESMLERISGVVFYGLFNSLLFASLILNKKE